MTSPPSVAAVIPTFNRGPSLADAVASVLRQTSAVDELIIIDDGSTDDTSTVLDSFAADRRVRVIRQENAGAAAARNAGILATTTSHVAFLDSDDEWLPDKIARQREMITVSGAELVCSSWVAWSPGRPEGLVNQWPGQPALVEELLIGCCIALSTAVVSRGLLDIVGLFDESLRTCEDLDLWLRIARQTTQIGCIADPLVRRRRDDGSTDDRSLSADSVQVARDMRLVCQRFLMDPRTPSRLAELASVHRARYLVTEACAYAERGWPRVTWGALAQAAVVRPQAIRPGWVRVLARASRVKSRQLSRTP